MDHLFDLDLALTMEQHMSLSDSRPAETKWAESESATNISDTYLPMMLTAPVTAVDDATVCTICMEGFGLCTAAGGGKQVPCGHVYHEHCITEWISLHNSCPLCRSIVSGDRKTTLAVMDPSSL